jgi:hypothetical protein
MKTIVPGVVAASLSFCACQKSAPTASISLRTDPAVIKPIHTDTLADVPYPTGNGNAPGCPVLPLYGDTLVYPQPMASGDDILLPANNPGPGKYFAWPAGLVIDHTTGAIDLTTSQTGLKYAIGFVAAGGTDTCVSTLIPGGAAYYDSLYVVANGGTRAVPYFDADPGAGNYCSNDNGAGNGCKFDITGSAAAQDVSVNNSSGEIDLQKTLNGNANSGGVFGTSPVDGQSVITTISYQLKKGSNKAVQQIQVQLVYYSSLSVVPASLQLTVNTRLNNVLNGFMISTSNNPRPPLIIIVRGR